MRIPTALRAALGALLAAATLAGCASTTLHPRAPHTRLVSPGAAYELTLGTPRAAVTRRFGVPVTRFGQPLPGRGTLDCLVYAGTAHGSYIRFCFAGGRLTVVGTALGHAALTPPPATPSGRTLTMHRDRTLTARKRSAVALAPGGDG